MSDDPVPAYFSFRYLLWVFWNNAQTCLLTLVAALAPLTADETLLTHTQAHWLIFAIGALGAVAARIKQTPPPMKVQSTPETP